MPFEFSVSDIVPASAQEIYDAWLSGSGHEKMTGGKPAQISPREGAEFTVWNGYIHTSYRDGGWQRSYFEPMKEYFKLAR